MSTHWGYENKKNDSRWVHRPKMDWQKTAQRNVHGSIEYKIFNGLKKMIAVRKELSAFADHNNRELLEVENPHLFVFARFDHLNTHSRVLVVANFDHQPQMLNVEALRKKGYFAHRLVKDLHTGDTIELADMQLTVPARGFFWLQT